MRPRLSASIAELFDTCTLEEKRRIDDTRVQPLMWTRGVNRALSRQITMSMLGVPHPQRKEVLGQYQFGVAGFVRESLEYVMRQFPVWTNYFRSVYVRGRDWSISPIASAVIPGDCCSMVLQSSK